MVVRLPVCESSPSSLRLHSRLLSLRACNKTARGTVGGRLVNTARLERSRGRGGLTLAFRLFEPVTIDTLAIVFQIRLK